VEWAVMSKKWPSIGAQGIASMSSSGVNKHLVINALIASQGGLLFGFDTAVIAGTTTALTKVYALTPVTLGITVSSALWGTIVGAVIAGKLSDRFGRRTCLRWLGLLYVLSALGCAFAWGWYPLLAFRVLSGLAIGSSSVISPTYIAEISPPKLRGRLVGAFQFNVVFGILLAYVSNYFVGQFSLGELEWRWKLGVAALPALCFFVSLFLIPESPRWLVGQGCDDEALGVLRRNGDRDPEKEMVEIANSLVLEQGLAEDRVFQWRYRFPIFLAISIGMFNQLSGINAILYYLNSIFERAGFNQVSSDEQAVMIGVVNLLAVSAAMLVIDKIGRRPLLIIGSIGTTCCLAGVGVSFQLNRGHGALLWLLMGFIGFFTFSQGAVIWVYLSEIFPNRVRAKGQSIGSFSHWFMNAVVSVVFPILATRWGSATPFYFFASMTALQFIVVLKLYPETRGVSLESIEATLHLQPETILS
jgi:SP family arabinose:H+ symporter-like MFS transporter